MRAATALREHARQRASVRNLSLFRKVVLALGLIALPVAAVLAWSVHIAANQAEARRTLDQDLIGPIKQAEELRDEVTVLHLSLLTQSQASGPLTPAVGSAAEASSAKMRLNSLEADIPRVLDAMPQAIPLDLASIRSAFAAYDADLRAILDAATSDAAPDLPTAIDKYNRVSSGLRAIIDDLSARYAFRARAVMDDSTQARNVVVSFSLGTICIMLLGALQAARVIARPVTALTYQMNRLAAGETDIDMRGLDRSDEVGAMTRAVQIFRDNMIARRQGEEILSETNLQLDATLNSMVQGILVWGPNHRVQVVNKRYAAVVGVTEGSVVAGMTVDDIVENYQSHGLHLDKPARAFGDMIRKLISGHPSTETEMVFRPDLIIRVITEPMENGGAVITYEDITERRQNQERIAYMADHDALTGLPNRKVFQERIDGLTASQPEQRPFAIFCLDLDRFKEVNDTLGHPAGDELLRLVSARLRACARDGDLIARLGGDEFAIILEGGRELPLRSLATRLIKSISAPYQLQGNLTVIGTSIGIVTSERDLSGSELLKRADLALYKAKEDRGTFVFFERGMDDDLHARRQLEADLRLAVLHNEFVLHYQPLYNVAEDRVTGFEALLRWNSPKRGFVAPDHFIPIAEQTGLIAPIGEWVLETACADAMQWPDQVRVCVNLSAMQIKSKRLLALVQEKLAITGLPARRLELEITETVLLQDTDAVIATLTSLRAMDVRISMDDFGTGYSSLSYLRRFPFDKLKIDRSFVSDLRGATGQEPTGALADSEQSAATIIRAIVGLGKNLGMATTAEGVETADQFALVRAMGCTEVQGYFVSMPKPASEVPSMLRGFRNASPSRTASTEAARQLAQTAHTEFSMRPEGQPVASSSIAA